MAGHDTRKHDRDSLFLMAQLRQEHDGQSLPVKLRNISDSGLLVEGSVRVARGAKVWVDLRNVGWVTATVVWAAGDRFGVAFDAPIEAASVRFPVAEVDLPEPDPAVTRQ